MGILDIFKKAFKQEKPRLNESVSFKSLKARLVSLEHELNKENIKFMIKREADSFILNSRENIKILENLSLKDRKEKENIKLLVKENIKVYLSYFKKLIEEIKNIEKLEEESYFNRLNEIISNFNKNSSQSFEKSTILVGDEIEKLKDNVIHLYRNINNIFNSNQQIFSKSKTIKEIISILDERDNLLAIVGRINNSISSLNIKRENTEELIRKKNQDIEDIKSNEEFRAAEKEKLLADKERQKLFSDIENVKLKMDLKGLIKKFHHVEKSRRLLQDYSEDFVSALKKDSALKIEELADIDASNLREKLLVKNKKFAIDDELLNISESLKLAEADMLALEKEIEDENARMQKLREKVSELESEIKELCLNINIEVFNL